MDRNRGEEEKEEVQIAESEVRQEVSACRFLL